MIYTSKQLKAKRLRLAHGNIFKVLRLELARGKFAKSDFYATIVIMEKKEIFITNSTKQTQKLGEMLAKELRGKEIICLTGELGSGKTTFAQGILKGLGVGGPYTSPTFIVMKQYKIFGKSQSLARQGSTFSLSGKLSNSSRSNLSRNSLPAGRQAQGRTLGIYHIDAYRVGPKDILDLGWEEIVSEKNNVVIVEWAEKIRTIVPKRAIWIELKHLEDDKRKIAF